MHDDCELWFAQLEDVFSSLGITQQTNKFAAVTTLLTEEEAYVVRDLTLLRRERPVDVLYTGRTRFVQRVELTNHQRLTCAFVIGGVDVNEKPSQRMARFRHASGDWTRDDVKRVTFLRRLLSSISEAPTELATAVYACDVPAFNALFRNRGSGKGSIEYKKPSSESQLC